MANGVGTVPSYRALLTAPGRLAFVGPGLLGRLPLAMRALGCVLLIQGYTGSYGLAGTIGAVQTIVSALAGPRLGRLADRRSHRFVLGVSLVCQVIATATLIALAASGSPALPLALGAALLGGSAIPFSSMSRAIWSAHVGRGPALERAFAVESVFDQIAFIVGPFFVILLSIELHPSAGLLGSLAMTALATAGFARLPSLAARTNDTVDSDLPVMRIRGMQVLVVTSFGLGVLYGATEVGLVAFAEEQGTPGAASLLVSLFAGGSLVGAIVYGARAWPWSLYRRTTVPIVWLCLAMLPIAFSPGIVWSAIAILVAGVSIAPGETAAFTLVERLIPQTARTEGFTWVLAAISAGAAAGVMVAGVGIDAGGARVGLLVAFAGGAIAVASLLLGAPSLRDSEIGSREVAKSGRRGDEPVALTAECIATTARHRSSAAGEGRGSANDGRGRGGVP